MSATFVVGPAVAPDTWTGFPDGFVEHLVPLEARLSGSPARG